MRRLFLFAAVVLLAGCAPATVQPPRTPLPTSTTSTAIDTSTTVLAESHAVLAGLTIDDHPHSDAGYRRDEWPHWLDIDHDGCDAREQALKAASTITPTTAAGCRVTGGHWVSAYDGKETDRPGDLDIDHVVALDAAYISGGWSWSTDQRTQFANDQHDLWAVSASSNRAKGSKGPDEWRPPERGAWCVYAYRWSNIKIHWNLTITTSEREALGEMLSLCDHDGRSAFDERKVGGH